MSLQNKPPQQAPTLTKLKPNLVPLQISTLLITLTILLITSCTTNNLPTDISAYQQDCPPADESYFSGGIFGKVPQMEGYQTIPSDNTWTLLGKPDQVMYIASQRKGQAQKVKQVLESKTGVIFVEIPRCGNSAWVSTPITNTRGVVGVIEGSTYTLVIIAARPDGKGAGVRRGLENILKVWLYNG